MEKKNIQRARTWPYKRYGEFERELRKAAAEWFSRKGFKTHPRRSYSLRTRDDWPQNIICPDVVDYIRQEAERHLGKNPFPLHQYIHHGLSSQAMVFNLIGPLIVRGDLEPLRNALERSGIAWPGADVTAEFEYDDRGVFNEDSGQPTCFDVALFGQGRPVFIESKLVEREFGSCSVFLRGDCDGRNPFLYGLDGCYLHHIGRQYWNRMTEFGFQEANLSSGHICPLSAYYQFFRELLFAFTKGGCFVLLHDERNPAFLKVSKGRKEAGLWSFLTTSVPARLAPNVGRVTIQQVADTIDESGRHHDWIGEFKAKYGIA